MFDNMSADEALSVIHEYYECMSGLQAMKHKQRMEQELVRFVDEKKLIDRRASTL